ncbi:MAG: HAD family hydrolase [Deltaproteobacteria bacterium]|nr:MAG: HAD family hydrolase [Deltaproteobacteria bacterium]
MTGAPDIRAVLFDFGGVILSSPIDSFRDYERTAQLPTGFLQRLNMLDPDTNAWACMERGELDEPSFCTRLEAEASALGHTIDARIVLSRLSGDLRPDMVTVIRALRSRYLVACLTNNMPICHGSAMARSPDLAAQIAEVMTLFAHVVESCKIGARKPEPRFYARACEIIGIAPEHCVFLDDLGINLKPARAMGMTTIKVSDPVQAITDLEAILGHPIR